MIIRVEKCYQYLAVQKINMQKKMAHFSGEPFLSEIKRKFISLLQNPHQSLPDRMQSFLVPPDLVAAVPPGPLDFE
jgi:hypothetical protein